MTENRDERAIDLMHRQQLLGGVKVPFLLSLSPGIIQMFNREANIDVGFPGNAYFGIPVAQSYEEIMNNMTWAMRYVKCSKELHNLCRSNEYMGTCWIHRDDFEPTTRQNNEPKGRGMVFCLFACFSLFSHKGRRCGQIRFLNLLVCLVLFYSFMASWK